MQPVKLFFQTYGLGAPLIILHGLLGSSSNWSTTGRLLGRQLQVFAVDLRNHGNSPHASCFNFDVMTEDLNCFMEDQNLQHATVLGHSLGGRVAMEFADRYPEKVDKLIVVDVAPKVYASTHKELIDAMMAIDLGMYESAKEVVAALATDIPPLQVRNFLAKNIYRLPTGSLAWKVNLRAIRDNYAGLCGSTIFKDRYVKPVLFVCGELSDYILEEDKAIIRKIYPHAQIASIAGAGHWVHIDAKDIFIDTVLKFID